MFIVELLFYFWLILVRINEYIYNTYQDLISMYSSLKMWFCLIVLPSPFPLLLCTHFIFFLFSYIFLVFWIHVFVINYNTNLVHSYGFNLANILLRKYYLICTNINIRIIKFTMKYFICIKEGNKQKKKIKHLEIKELVDCKRTSQIKE